MGTLRRIADLLDSGSSLTEALRKVDALGYLEIQDGVTAPPAGSGMRLFVDTSDGDLKCIFSDETIKTITIDT